MPKPVPERAPALPECACVDHHDSWVEADRWMNGWPFDNAWLADQELDVHIHREPLNGLGHFAPA
jgi:hypothetical protein